MLAKKGQSLAIGQRPNLLALSNTPNLNVDRKRRVVADPVTGKTTKQGVFAGVDTVTGVATMIDIMGAVKHLAKTIDEYLKAGS